VKRSVSAEHAALCIHVGALLEHPRLGELIQHGFEFSNTLRELLLVALWIFGGNLWELGRQLPLLRVRRVIFSKHFEHRVEECYLAFLLCDPLFPARRLLPFVRIYVLLRYQFLGVDSILLYQLHT